MKYFLLPLFLVLISATIKLNEQGKFIDSNGNIRVFHGLNVVYKPEPYFPVTDHFDVMTSFSEEDCQLLVSLGFNMIRLHVAFEAGMPERGVVNDEYLLHIRDIVRMAAKYGIYVLLDAHQDLMSRKFCGEGFPDWAITSKNFPYPQKINITFNEKGYPDLKDCLKQNFAKYYMTEDVGRNVENILNNVDGVADMFGLFWKRVAELHKDEENVLGYELINEPSSGNYERSKVEYILPGWANKKLIMPFYKIVNKYIREVDQEKLVFFEPYFTDAFGGGFTGNVGGEEYRLKEVFSYHIYCGFEKTNPWFCRQINNMLYYFKKKNINQLGTGSFLTEFGAVPNELYAQQQIDGTLTHAEDILESWSYWQYKGYNDYTTASNLDEEGIFNSDGTFQDLKLKGLVRPYFQNICANSIDYVTFTLSKGVFDAQYSSNSECSSVLYIPSRYHYENGFSSTCQNCSITNGDKKDYYIVQGQGKIQVRIVPK